MLKWLRRETPPQETPTLKTSGQKIVFLLGLLGVLAVGGQIAWLALQTITTLLAAVIVGLCLFLGVLAFPAITRWWKVQVIKMLKATARRNPVETLQAEVLERQRSLQAARQRAVQITAHRDSLKETLDEYQKKHGGIDPVQQRMYDKLNELVGRLRTSLNTASAKLTDFEKFVEMQADRWKIAKQTGELAEMLRQAHGGDVTGTFLANTAIETIRGELNLSFAEIEQVLDSESANAQASVTPLQLEHTTVPESLPMSTPAQARGA